MLHKLFGFATWYMTLMVVIVFWSSAALAQAAPAIDPAGDITVVDGSNLEEILAAAIAEASRQLGSGGTLESLFTSPAFLTILFGLLGSVVTYFMTNGIKLSTSWVKGRKTQIVAGLIATLTAGVGGYFGLGEVAGVGGVNGALLAALASLGSFGIAVGAHEGKRQKQAGLRKPERKASSGVSDIVNSPVGQLAKSGLVALAIKYALPGGGLLVDALLSEHTLEQAERIIHSMGKKRALNQAEIEDSQDQWEVANSLPQVVRASEPKNEGA